MWMRMRLTYRERTETILLCIPSMYKKVCITFECSPGRCAWNGWKDSRPNWWRQRWITCHVTTTGSSFLMNFYRTAPTRRWRNKVSNLNINDSNKYILHVWWWMLSKTNIEERDGKVDYYKWLLLRERKSQFVAIFSKSSFDFSIFSKEWYQKCFHFSRLAFNLLQLSHFSSTSSGPDLKRNGISLV